MLLTSYLDTVYQPSRLMDASLNTVRLYRLSIGAFSGTLGKSAEIADLTNENLRRHLARRLADRRSPATANKDRAQLLAIWRHAAQHGFKSEWPDVRELREPVRAPVAWLPGECETLLAHVETEAGLIGYVPARLFWSALLHVLLDTGERIGAIMQARWDWFSRDGRFLTVPAEARKGRSRDKVFAISPEAMLALQSLRAKQRGPLVFAWPYNRCCLWRKFGGVLQRAGLPSDRRSKFHRLRKTVATAVYAAGGDAQRALDHRDARTTESYLDPRVTADSRTPDHVLAYRRSAV